MPGDVLTATVERTEAIAPHVREIVLRPGGFAPLAYAPGQWISLRLPVGGKPPLIRAYSLATPPRPDGRLILCFDHVENGLGSAYLWEIGIGETIEFTGPVGNFVLPGGEDPLVFVARFTGIVPFRAMLQAMDNRSAPARPVHLVYGASTAADLVYHEELTGLAARAPWLDYRPIVGEAGPGWSGPQGAEIDLLQTHVRSWLPCIPMICGVREFTAPARAFFQDEIGLERRQVRVENYSGPTAR